jgi:hypothetical protein
MQKKRASWESRTIKEDTFSRNNNIESLSSSNMENNLASLQPNFKSTYKHDLSIQADCNNGEEDKPNSNTLNEKQFIDPKFLI